MMETDKYYDGRIVRAIFDTEKEEEQKRFKESVGKAIDNLEIKQVQVDKNIGRNDPCPCDSGKKFKKCCGSVLEKENGDG